MACSLLQKTKLKSENKEMNLKYRIKIKETHYMGIRNLKKRKNTDKETQYLKQ